MKDCCRSCVFLPFQTLFSRISDLNFSNICMSPFANQNPSQTNRYFLAYAFTAAAAKAFAAASICSRVMISVAHQSVQYAVLDTSGSVQCRRQSLHRLAAGSIRRGFFGLQNKLVEARRAGEQQLRSRLGAESFGRVIRLGQVMFS